MLWPWPPFRTFPLLFDCLISSPFECRVFATFWFASRSSTYGKQSSVINQQSTNSFNMNLCDIPHSVQPNNPMKISNWTLVSSKYCNTCCACFWFAFFCFKESECGACDATKKRSHLCGKWRTHQTWLSR